MPVVKFLPDDRLVEVRPGTTLLEAARKAKVTVRTRCGGYLGCMMCKVKVTDPAGLVPAKPNETLKLGALADQGFRFACQARIQGDVTAELPEDPLKAAVRRQLAKQREEEE